MSGLNFVSVLVALALLAVIARFDAVLLKDLAATPDHELNYLTRAGWVVAIVATFPIGPLLYLRIGKGPRRYV
jgi:hypothetical protein